MIRLICALLLGLLCFAQPSQTHAQSCGPSNPNCIVPDRPAGDSTEAAANTKFVTSSLASLPLPSTQIYIGSLAGLAVAQSLSGAGDCSVSLANNGVMTLTCTKTNGVAFAASATTDTTNASNISSGSLNTARLPSPFTNGTASGNTSKFATVSGTTPNGHFASYDVNGNIVDGGAGGAGITSLVCNGVTITTTGTCPPSFGFQNCSLAASVASNLLTVALKDNAGSDPSASSPCNMWFRNVTASTGSWTQVTQTAALSISSNATGASLGSVANTAFRIWVVVFNNGGTPVLGLVNLYNFSSTAPTLFPLNEGLVASSTAISGSATAAGTIYTPNGTTISSKAFLILGYVEYNATGLATPGTYASAPNFIQTMGPGTRKPGEPIQSVTSSGSTAATTTSASFVVLTGALTLTITPTSAANPIQVATYGGGANSTANSVAIQLCRGTSTLIGIITGQSAPAAGSTIPLALDFLDLPNTISGQLYQVQAKTTGGTFSYPGGANSAPAGAGASFKATEIMG